MVRVDKMFCQEMMYLGECPGEGPPLVQKKLYARQQIVIRWEKFVDTVKCVTTECRTSLEVLLGTAQESQLLRHKRRTSARLQDAANILTLTDTVLTAIGTSRGQGVEGKFPQTATAARVQHACAAPLQIALVTVSSVTKLVTWWEGKTIFEYLLGGVYPWQQEWIRNFVDTTKTTFFSNYIRPNSAHLCSIMQ